MKTTDKIWDRITRRDKAVTEKIDQYIESLKPKKIREYTEDGVTITVYESR